MKKFVVALTAMLVIGLTAGVAGADTYPIGGMGDMIRFIDLVKDKVDSTATQIAENDTSVGMALDSVGAYVSDADTVWAQHNTWIRGADDVFDAHDQALDTLAAYMANLKAGLDSLRAKLNDHVRTADIHSNAADDMKTTAEADSVPASTFISAYAWTDPDTSVVTVNVDAFAAKKAAADTVVAVGQDLLGITKDVSELPDPR
jgi:ABC-type transporter Mla subunit MlaD